MRNLILIPISVLVLISCASTTMAGNKKKKMNRSVASFEEPVELIENNVSRIIKQVHCEGSSGLFGDVEEVIYNMNSRNSGTLVADNDKVRVTVGLGSDGFIIADVDHKVLKTRFTLRGRDSIEYTMYDDYEKAAETIKVGETLGISILRCASPRLR